MNSDPNPLFNFVMKVHDFFIFFGSDIQKTLAEWNKLEMT